MATTQQGELFEGKEGVGSGDGTAVVNERCCVQTRGGCRVVTVGGLPLTHYAVGDRMGEAHAMVSLVEQGWAKQTEVACAFGCSERTVRRSQRRFEAGRAGSPQSRWPAPSPLLPGVPPQQRPRRRRRRRS